MTPQHTGDRLQGKVAIVSGGGSGFGEGIAIRFAQEGAKVIVADMNPVSGQRVAAIFPASMTFVQMDVTSKEDWKSLVAKAVEEHGRVDVLVNNAGTSYKNKPTLEVTEDEFDKVFNVNVKSIFHSTHAFIPKLLEQKQGGSIINIASIGATRPRPGLVWYNASKAAVCNATKALAAEYGPQNVRVNSVCPLLTPTGLFETFIGMPDTPENRDKFLFNVPLGRLGKIDDIANYCLYLASDEANFVTGTCLEVDGGRGI